MGKKLTQEEFIARVCDIHGDRYGLEKVVYVGAETPVVLYCKKHGDFLIKPSQILYAHQGCAKCAGKNKTTEDFIKEATDKHGNKYSYSNAIYKGSKNKVVITCPIHGDFKMLPYNHVVLGCNCPECSNVAKVTQEIFLRRAKEKYGDKFDYSLINFVNNETPVVIRCNTCNTTFEQTPDNHIHGLRGGCPTCRYKFVADAERVSFDDFVRRAKEIHGDKYTYHEESYKNIKDKTVITCDKHGDFEQVAISHVNGCGCESCANEKVSKSFLLPADEFISRASDLYGDRFDLSKAKYNGLLEKVTIKCNTCSNSFEQTAGNFLRGFGCPICNTPAGEARISCFLKSNNVEFQEQYEIQNEYLFCSNKKIFVDFYVKSYNLIIEFNGDQHYRPLRFFGGVKAFEKQQERDNAVRQYCKDHKIKLLEIPYKDLNNIENILKKELGLKS